MGYRLSKIYTRTGDDGTTGLGDGSRVEKESPRMEAIGCIDELNSLIGLLIAHQPGEEISKMLTEIQQHLFDLGGELAIPGHLVITEYAVSNWSSSWTASTLICRHSESSSSPAAISQRQAVTMQEPSAAAPNGA